MLYTYNNDNYRICTNPIKGKHRSTISEQDLCIVETCKPKTAQDTALGSQTAFGHNAALALYRAKQRLWYNYRRRAHVAQPQSLHCAASRRITMEGVCVITFHSDGNKMYNFAEDYDTALDQAQSCVWEEIDGVYIASIDSHRLATDAELAEYNQAMVDLFSSPDITGQAEPDYIEQYVMPPSTDTLLSYDDKDAPHHVVHFADGGTATLYTETYDSLMNLIATGYWADRQVIKVDYYSRLFCLFDSWTVLPEEDYYSLHNLELNSRVMVASKDSRFYGKYGYVAVLDYSDDLTYGVSLDYLGACSTVLHFSRNELERIY